MEGAASGDGAAPPARMTTVSRHYFGGSASEGHHDLRVDIVENIQEDYGMFVWPCSIILAEYVWQQRSRFSGSRVVELGAGTSLPGLVAAKVGAHVTLTDIAQNTEVLNNIRRICALNKVNCTVWFQDLRGETGMNRYSICILTLFLELMCFTIQQILTISSQQ
ncbi:hypothetical protein BS78_04G015000 [Paspalum vaginatum]|nr:hypothetical protein BS78_04G015000 [Paspalum vaginatum]